MRSYELTVRYETDYGGLFWHGGRGIPDSEEGWRSLTNTSKREEVVKFQAKNDEEAKKRVENNRLYKKSDCHRQYPLRLVEVKNRGKERWKREIKFHQDLLGRVCWW